MRLDIGRAPLTDEVVAEILSVLDRGGVIAYPTETVYGLGCDAGNSAAVQRICDLKGRETGKSMLVLVSSAEAAGAIAESVSPQAAILMARFWPGPLTLVFRTLADFPEALTAGKGRIAIRVSPDRVCRSILERYGKPLVSTSANPSGMEPARTAGQVDGYFGGRVELILDGGERSLSAPSTVVDVSGPIPLVLRRGPVRVEDMRDAVGEIREHASL